MKQALVEHMVTTYPNCSQLGVNSSILNQCFDCYGVESSEAKDAGIKCELEVTISLLPLYPYNGLRPCCATGGSASRFPKSVSATQKPKACRLPAESVSGCTGEAEGWSAGG